MKLLKKLVEIRKQVEFIKKDTKGFNYKYVSGYSILSSIRPKMDEVGVLLVTDIYESNVSKVTVSDKSGEHIEQVVDLSTKMTWLDSDSEDKLEQHWTAKGQDADISKAYGKALTYAERYYLLKVFNIPTDENDPDGEQGSKRVVSRSTNPDQRDTQLRANVERLAKSVFSSKDLFLKWCEKNNFPQELSLATDLALKEMQEKLGRFK